MRPALAATLLAATLLASSACKRHHDEPPPAPPAPAARPPIRGAAGDADLRVMLAELASAKACEMIRGQFRGLRDPERPDVVTGVLWIHDCKITSEGTQVTFHLGCSGWQWAEQTQHKGGATFQVKQYVKFDVDTTIPGALDMAYDQKTHVVSLWFTPRRVDVKFAPIGDVSVDEKGLWSSVVGALGAVFASSPDEQATQQAKQQGAQQFKSELADGLSVTINLCSGLARFNLGRPAKGKMVEPDVGETRHLPVEVQPGGLMVFGPQLVGPAMSAHIDARGSVRVALVCHEQAEAAAAAFLKGEKPRVHELASATVTRGAGELRIPRTSCPVALLAWPLDGPATFDYQRPAKEIARSTGGPLIACEHSPTPSPESSPPR